MAITKDVEGVLVAAEERTYEAFTTREGEQRPGGVTYRVYVVEAFDREPVEVRVEVHDFSDLRALGLGTTVKLGCELRANGNRLNARLIPKQVEVLKRPGQAKA